MLTFLSIAGGFNFKRSGTFPQGGCRSALPLSKGAAHTLWWKIITVQVLTDLFAGFFGEPGHCAYFHPLSDDFLHRCEPQWFCGLDGGSAERSAGMDGPVSVH